VLSVPVGTMVIIFETIVSTGTVGSGVAMVSVLSMPVGTIVTWDPMLTFPKPAFDRMSPVHPADRMSRTINEVVRTKNACFTGSLNVYYEEGKFEHCYLMLPIDNIKKEQVLQIFIISQRK
jgi:hypothetical protein